MATGKKKTILVYFLQKTSGTYSETSLFFLRDLLVREGISSAGESIEVIGSELASYVRDGTYLKLSTKKIPEHIRAQIDFFLQKNRRMSKKSSASSSSSAFDELLASIDSDDPKFTMDTTLGLDFSSLEELESDLKKHALDSLSPSLFSRQTGAPKTPARSFSQPYESYASPASSAQDEFDDVDSVYAQEQELQQRTQSHASRDYESQLNSPSSSDMTSVAQSYIDATNSPQFAQPTQSSASPQPMRQMGENFSSSIHSVPQFPTQPQLSAQVPASFSQLSVPAVYSAFVPSQQMWTGGTDNTSAAQRNEQQQLFAQLQLRMSILDAKERLLSSRLGSTTDPAVLRAVSLLDEKLLQISQQQAQLQSQQQSLQQSSQQFMTIQQDVGSSVPTHSAAVAPLTNAGKSLASQIKSYVQEIIGAQKSLTELQHVFVSAAHHSTAPVVAPVQQITPAQVRELAKQEKQEVGKLRNQLSTLQEQVATLTNQLATSQQFVQSQQTQPRQSPRSYSVSHMLRGKIKPLKTSTVARHEMAPRSLAIAQTTSQRMSSIMPDSDAPESTMEPLSFDMVSSTSPAVSFESDEPTLQKMYALLAVGMRELVVSPVRARHIYEQLQRLYATLSFDQKPIIYPSIVEFYASLSNQMRGGGVQ